MTLEYRYDRDSAPKTEGRSLNGQAAPFNRETVIGGPKYGFREKIAPGAFKKSINDGDVVLLDNHDSARPIARQSAGSLEMRETKPGLQWDATPANTSYANDVLENARAGNYGGCSFGFEVVKDSWERGENGELDLRTLEEVRLREISVCTFPAYGDTKVSARDQVEAAFEAREMYFERTMRAKYSADELKSMLAKGQAFKNAKGEPSYPIGDKEDLSKAIHAVGRGGADHNAIRKYIMRRAKALGASDMIPDNWASDGSVKAGEAMTLEPRENEPEDATVQQQDTFTLVGVRISAEDVVSRAKLETDLMLILANGELTPQARCDAILHTITIGMQQRMQPAEDERDDPDGKEYAAIDAAVRALSKSKPDVAGALKTLKANQANRPDDEKNEETNPDAETREGDSEPDTSTRTEDDMRDALRKARLRAAA